MPYGSASPVSPHVDHLRHLPEEKYVRLLYALAGAVLVISNPSWGHGLIQDPPSRNWFCGAVTKPDHVLNGVAQYPACGGAFANDFSGGYSFMSVLTHDLGRSAVRPLPQNVCGFNSETWQGRSTPWDQPINWPTTNISPGPRTFTWNISWGSHFSDTKEFQYWITKPGFQYQVGQPLSWADFEDAPFCSLQYDDSSSGANPDVVPDKAKALFHTKCTVPQRQGRHVIYAEWGRNHFTFERFHGCVDVVIGGSSSGFTLGTSTPTLNVAPGQNVTATINISRTGGFTGPVQLTASGLPAGVTAAFSPSTVTGNTATLTLTAASVASGTATVTVSGAGDAASGTLPLTLTIVDQAQFSIAAPSGPVSVTQASNATQTITITRTGGFTAPISLSASGLPSGVTAGFNPTSATGSTTILTLTASGAATPGSASVVVTGTSGNLTRTAQITIFVTAPTSGSFGLSASQSPTFNQGASGTASIAINRLNGFSGLVSFTASQLPAGVTASFNPAQASGASTTLTLSASNAAITGAASALVTATSGGMIRTLSVPFTITSAGSGAAVTAAPRINVNQPWYNEVALHLSNTAPITALSVTISVQKTAGIAFAGQYNTIGSQIQQATRSTPTAVVYEYVLRPGQSLNSGGYKLFAAQASGNGTAHSTSGDTYEVRYTVGGVSFTESGRF